MNINIIPFQNKYRDDAIFCVLLAKDGMGRKPGLNEDMLDIEKNYFQTGNMFWVAIDENDRVVGTIGVKIVSATDMWLKRLFVKPQMKRLGIGSQLVSFAEQFANENGIKYIHTRFLNDFMEAPLFYSASGFVETEKSEGMRHFVKDLINL